MKYRYQSECPCGDYEFSITYNSEHGKVTDIYCPFCSVLIDDDNQDDPENDDE
jgi:hypothetical protein